MAMSGQMVEAMPFDDLLLLDQISLVEAPSGSDPSNIEYTLVNGSETNGNVQAFEELSIFAFAIEVDHSSIFDTFGNPLFPPADPQHIVNRRRDPMQMDPDWGGGDGDTAFGGLISAAEWNGDPLVDSDGFELTSDVRFGANGLFIETTTGRTVREAARLFPSCKIHALVKSPELARKLLLVRGTTPIVFDLSPARQRTFGVSSFKVLVYLITTTLSVCNRPRDYVVGTMGHPIMGAGGTNTLIEAGADELKYLYEHRRTYLPPA